MTVATLFGERENTEQVNCVVSSMLQACPLHPRLLTHRCGAANRRFGPKGDIAPVAHNDGSARLSVRPYRTRFIAPGFDN
jgi:hypothetical protein